MRQSEPALQSRPTQLQPDPQRPGTQPQMSADTQPRHPRYALAPDPGVRFTDWGLI